MTVCGTRWTRRLERNEWSEGDGERAEHDGRNRKGIDQRRRIDEREREGGSGTGQGSMERCSGTVVPCTQPNNRDQPSLMCA